MYVLRVGGFQRPEKQAKGAPPLPHPPSDWGESPTLAGFRLHCLGISEVKQRNGADCSDTGKPSRFSDYSCISMHMRRAAWLQGKVSNSVDRIDTNSRLQQDQETSSNDLYSPRAKSHDKIAYTFVVKSPGVTCPYELESEYIDKLALLSRDLEQHHTRIVVVVGLTPWSTWRGGSPGGAVKVLGEQLQRQASRNSGTVETAAAEAGIK
eukprot:scaffold112357_cov22-Tisochrysis_lutea.AAC.1